MHCKTNQTLNLYTETYTKGQFAHSAKLRSDVYLENNRGLANPFLYKKSRENKIRKQISGISVVKRNKRSEQ